LIGWGKEETMSSAEPSTGLSSTANVTVERPSRWAKQLATHMGHKAHATETPQGWELFFDPSRASLTPHDAAESPTLVMAVWSPTRDGLESIQAALERHLQKFTARIGGVIVVWHEG
jgi:hypothetical protein